MSVADLPFVLLIDRKFVGRYATLSDARDAANNPYRPGKATVHNEITRDFFWRENNWPGPIHWHKRQPPPAATA